MKVNLWILSILLVINAKGQSYLEFSQHTDRQLRLHQQILPPIYYAAFRELILHRDSNILNVPLNRDGVEQDADSSCIILTEGYDWSTGKYGVVQACQVPVRDNWYGLQWINGQVLTWGRDSVMQCENPLTPEMMVNKVDSFLPRSYRFGAGCVITPEKLDCFRELGERATLDGEVTEHYCKIITLIDRIHHQMYIHFYIPVKGPRLFVNYGGGDTTDWPPGLDFWLMVTPLRVGEMPTPLYSTP